MSDALQLIKAGTNDIRVRSGNLPQMQRRFTPHRKRPMTTTSVHSGALLMPEHRVTEPITVEGDHRELDGLLRVDTEDHTR
jgi:hypothetical protein